MASRERHNIRFVDLEESNTGLQTCFGRQAPFGIKSLPSSVVVVVIVFFLISAADSQFAADSTADSG